MKKYELKDDYVDTENYECNFPIDLVILWCDDTPEFLQKRTYWQNKLGLQQDKNITKERFETVDELKYLLRSVELYAPWINHIFLVTDNQCPKWLNRNNPKITIVDHAEIMPSEILPTYNSFVIEAYIHKIPHLSEHFIYANDDMLFSQPVSPQFFFDKDGNPIIRFHRDFSFTDNNHARVVLHAYDVMEQKYQIKYTQRYHLHHCTDAYRKSYMADTVCTFADEYQKTSCHKFREDDDLIRNIISLDDIYKKRATLKILSRNSNQDSDVLWNCSSYQVHQPAKTCLICVNTPTEFSRSYLSYHYPRPSVHEKIPVTIITICYNIKNEIERTCESIVNQTWQDFEWIVVDGGSTDGTVDVLKKYQDRMSVFISEKDKGIYNAMNKGIKRARGEWLNFMNGGDCFAANDVLEKVFKGKEYEADVLYGSAKMIYLDGSIYISTYPDKLSKKYFYHGNINHQATFIKRELFNKYGLYNEKYLIVSDYEKWVIFAHHNCKFEPLKLRVADFWMGGISSMLKRYLDEREAIHYKYYLRLSKYKLFGFIPLLSIEEK